MLKSTEGRRESGPLQRRRQLLRDVRAGQVGETVEPGQEGAAEVLHRTRLRGAKNKVDALSLSAKRSEILFIRFSTREDRATTANWSPVEWTRPSSCGTSARGVRSESTGGE